MRSEKIDELYFSDVDEPIKLDRRDFLKKLGGGILIVFSIGKLSLVDGFSNTTQEVPGFNAYLLIKQDGTINCYTGKIEMGQGIITSLAQVVADELEVDINDVKMVMGDTELCPYDAGTWGSLTTRFADPVLRAAAAEAREVLKELAAEKLNVSKDELMLKNGTIYSDNNSNLSVTYANITKGKKIVRSLQSKPDIKNSTQFTLIGKPLISTDAIDKVTGKAQYSADIKLPNMVYATVVRPPVVGSTKLSIDTSKMKDFADVELIEDDNMVAVVHENPETSKLAARKLKVNWETPKAKFNDETVFKYLEDNISDNEIFQEEGNLASGANASTHIITATYNDGYKAHAPMETHTATCYFKNNKLTMWASTQTPFGTQNLLARELSIPKENVHIKQIFLGGGFGGKIYNQQAVECAKIAKKCGKPVQLMWSRKEEFMYDKFRPAATTKVKAGIDSNGKLTLWEFDIYCAGTRGTKLFYKIPDNRTRIFNDRAIHPFGVGAWRAPGNNTTTFARESHIDIMAHKAGIDPLQFRLNNLESEEMINTLKLAAKTFDWDKPKKENHGYGIALGVDAGTFVAIIAEVSVNKKTGKVQPIKMVCAQDMGQVVNPHGATVQTEGGITMGIGYALFEDVEFNGGNVKSRNFKNYTITKFSTTPEIKCVFIDKMDAKPQGGGEPAIICVGGAIANAVFDASGARVYQMPITPKRVLANFNN